MRCQKLKKDRLRPGEYDAIIKFIKEEEEAKAKAKSEGDEDDEEEEDE